MPTATLHLRTSNVATACTPPLAPNHHTNRHLTSATLLRPKPPKTAGQNPAPHISFVVSPASCPLPFVPPCVVSYF
ncbi:hypothetical protein BVRB_6g142790 [Beta vulgaris subsp. vulgaris]|nr:hypothetical protein BVRB_6g142790 [Beta vulgaris subsp. vulgaris]